MHYTACSLRVPSVSLSVPECSRKRTIAGTLGRKRAQRPRNSDAPGRDGTECHRNPTYFVTSSTGSYNRFGRASTVRSARVTPPCAARTAAPAAEPEAGGPEKDVRDFGGEGVSCSGCGFMEPLPDAFGERDIGQPHRPRFPAEQEVGDAVSRRDVLRREHAAVRPPLLGEGDL